MKLYERYLDYLQESEWFDKVQRNLIDLKYKDDPTGHALKMKELLAKIAKRKSLIKKGAVGAGVAAVGTAGYLAYKKLKDKKERN